MDDGGLVVAGAALAVGEQEDRRAAARAPGRRRAAATRDSSSPPGTSGPSSRTPMRSPVATVNGAEVERSLGLLPTTAGRGAGGSRRGTASSCARACISSGARRRLAREAEDVAGAQRAADQPVAVDARRAEERLGLDAAGDARGSRARRCRSARSRSRWPAATARRRAGRRARRRPRARGRGRRRRRRASRSATSRGPVQRATRSASCPAGCRRARSRGARRGASSGPDCAMPWWAWLRRPPSSDEVERARLLDAQRRQRAARRAAARAGPACAGGSPVGGVEAHAVAELEQERLVAVRVVDVLERGADHVPAAGHQHRVDRRLLVGDRDRRARGRRRAASRRRGTCRRSSVPPIIGWPTVARAQTR